MPCCSSGGILERCWYKPYGEVICYNESTQATQASSFFGNPYLFQGRRLDSDTGLYYFRNRMYSATHGRFLQQDPTGYQDSFNLYEAFGGRPVSVLDPTGAWYLEGGSAVAEAGDTLSGLSDILYGDGRRWKELGFTRDPKTLQIGEKIDISGRLDELCRDIKKYDSTLNTIERAARSVHVLLGPYDPMSQDVGRSWLEIADDTVTAIMTLDNTITAMGGAVVAEKVVQAVSKAPPYNPVMWEGFRGVTGPTSRTLKWVRRGRGGLAVLGAMYETGKTGVNIYQGEYGEAAAAASRGFGGWLVVFAPKAAGGPVAIVMLAGEGFSAGHNHAINKQYNAAVLQGNIESGSALYAMHHKYKSKLPAARKRFEAAVTTLSRFNEQP